MIHPILICSDKSGAGKDYAANKIVQVLAHTKKITSGYKIAQELKVFCEDYFNTFPIEDYEVNRELRTHPLPGLQVENVVDLWIKVGEFFRNLDNTFWIRECVQRIIKFATPYSSTYFGYYPVISDFRFDCEYDYFLTLPNLFMKPTILRIIVPDGRGKVNASDGKVTLSPDYEIVNCFDNSFDKALEEFCEQFITNMEIQKHGNP